MKIIYLVLLLLSGFGISFSQNLDTEIIISKDLELIKLTDNVYVHVSYYEMEPYGRFPSNGMIYINNQEAYLFDTPMNEELTKELVSFIQDSLNIRIVGFIPNHWHDDCVGGLEYLNKLKINSYANQMTIELSESKNLALPKNGFTDSLRIKFGENEIICKYPGAGHSTDNIVVWLPSEKVLFGGCMVKEMSAKGLGNLSDANLKQWPLTIKKVINEFPNAKYVIPGHGKVGGTELLAHTFELLTNKK